MALPSSTRSQNGAASLPDRRLLALTVLAPLLANADAGIVTLALTDIRRDLSMSLSSVQWVTNAYVLLVSGLQLLGGRLADLAGARRLFLHAMTAFALASAACGAAPSGPLLVLARAGQGLAAAVLVPAAMSLLVTAVAPHQRARALALWAGAGGVGSVAGVLFGGLVVSGLDWRWAFYLNVPVIAAALALARRTPLPDPPRPGGVRLDLVGAAALTGALLALVYALVRTAEHGTDRDTVWSASAALALGAVLAYRQRTCPSPLLPPALVRDRGLVSGAAGVVLVSTAVAPVVFLGGMQLREAHGYGALAAGFALLPLVGGVFLVGRPCSALLTRHGARLPCALGCLLLGAGLWTLAARSHVPEYATGMLPGLLLAGAGLPLIWMSCEIVALARFDGPGAGLAAGVVQCAGQLGTALGTVLAVAVCGRGTGVSEGAGQAFAAAALLMVPALAGALFGLPDRRRPGAAPLPQAAPRSDPYQSAASDGTARGRGGALGQQVERQPTAHA
ncbi:MFS transporter [Streptomyces sp. Tu 3180]|uniref:MFS transporter n=1 Tax=Streptomyces sp. Tu 3180 TaxID=2682611 RepID=UPI00135ABD11|nr:MFS transporter [Streptomyces sp. Tu 3180]KAF3468291.1 MFS transporter [Streptomyces sp. Tu 3180]